MARTLTATQVTALRYDGNGKAPVSKPVGGAQGLYLQITPGGSRSWLLRYTSPNGKRREMGLGKADDISLSKARDRAKDLRDQIWQGIDPLDQRSETKSVTFTVAKDNYLRDVKKPALANAKHFMQWGNTLTAYADPVLGHMPVDAITMKDILRVLQPIWQTKTVTASTLRARIEAVLSYATVSGHREGDNPARWKGNLEFMLAPPTKVHKTTNQPAIQLDDAAGWFADLRKREGFGSRALEFAMLTAARSGEVRGAKWDEIDLDRRIWTVPADRMKMDREHRVPLPPAAIDMLKALPRFKGVPYVFPSSRNGQLSDMTLSATMRRMHADKFEADQIGYIDRVSKRPAVPHGLRSTFRDWAAERTDFPGDMAEVALAHKVGNAVEAAYRRGDMMEKRRAMMQAWADFLHA